VRRRLKIFLKALGGLVGVGALGLTGYAWVQASAFDASMARVYDVPAPPIARSTNPDDLARGKHLNESVAPCAASACHGNDLGGGEAVSLGPVATLRGPNITRTMTSYTDGELARLLRHGLKNDGRSVAFMPVQDFAWLPDDDLVALVSYLRTVPPVGRPDEQPGTSIRLLGKVLDRKDQMILDVARRIDHAAGVRPKGATPTVEYGRFLAMGCQGCHGEHLSGGRLPGAPSSVPIPLNLTPDATGLRDWTKDDLDRLLDTGVKRNGQKLDPFMPYEAFAKYDKVEREALWAFLRSVPAIPFGRR
jgi:cytochrome c553